MRRNLFMIITICIFLILNFTSFCLNNRDINKIVIIDKSYSFAELEKQFRDGNALSKNTKYVIKNKYDLEGRTLVIGQHCALEFDGGCFINGEVNCNGSLILNSIFQTGLLYNYIIPNKKYISIEWFKYKGNSYTDAIVNAVKQAHIYKKPVYLPKGEYDILGVDITYDDIEIYGDGPQKTIIKNPTWGMWNFRSSSDNLTIHDIGCSAIAVNYNTVHEVENEEHDNAASFILYKGNHGHFYNIYGQEIQCIIWLGGDYIRTFKYGNLVHDIEANNTSFAVLAAYQDNMEVYNITGNAKQMIGIASGGERKRVGPPAHLMYLTGRNNYNSVIHHITTLKNYHDNSGAVWGCSFKGIHNCYIHDIVVHDGGVVFEEMGDNNHVKNLTIYGAGSYIDGYNLLIHDPIPRINNKISFENIKIINGLIYCTSVSVSFNKLVIDNRNFQNEIKSDYMAKFVTTRSCKVFLNNVNMINSTSNNGMNGLYVAGNVSGEGKNIRAKNVEKPYFVGDSFVLNP